MVLGGHAHSGAHEVRSRSRPLGTEKGAQYDVKVEWRDARHGGIHGQPDSPVQPATTCLPMRGPSISTAEAVKAPGAGRSFALLSRLIGLRVRGSVRFVHFLARFMRHLQAVPAPIDGATVFLDLRQTFCTDLLLGVRPEPRERLLMQRCVKQGYMGRSCRFHG